MFYSKLLVLMVDFQLQHLLLVGYSNKIIHAHNATLNIILDFSVLSGLNSYIHRYGLPMDSHFYLRTTDPQDLRKFVQ